MGTIVEALPKAETTTRASSFNGGRSAHRAQRINDLYFDTWAHADGPFDSPRTKVEALVLGVQFKAAANIADDLYSVRLEKDNGGERTKSTVTMNKDEARKLRDALIELDLG